MHINILNYSLCIFFCYFLKSFFWFIPDIDWKEPWVQDKIPPTPRLTFPLL